MRRSHLFLFALLPLAAAIPAHAQLVSHTAAAALPPVAVDDVLARVMAFDRNGDGKVDRVELIERMHPLVTRGDVDGNEALDAGEVRALARAPRKPVQVQGIPSGTYGFADEEELSSRSHIENTLDDLRLYRATRDRALAIALTYVDTLETTATADLLTELKDLLTTEQLAVERQLRGRTVGNRIVGKDVIHVEHHLDDLKYQLPAAKAEQARAAVQRFKTRVGLGPEERSQLLAALKDTLNDEERDNFAAAIARRPVVRSGGGVFFGTHVIGRFPADQRAPAPGAQLLQHAIFIEGVTPKLVR